MATLTAGGHREGHGLLQSAHLGNLQSSAKMQECLEFNLKGKVATDSGLRETDASARTQGHLPKGAWARRINSCEDLWLSQTLMAW